MLRLKFTHEKVGLGLISLGLEENKVSKISGVKFTPGEAGPRRFVISEISIHEFFYFQSGQNEVHSIDQKDLLPLKDISTTQQKPVKFELGPVCFQ